MSDDQRSDGANADSRFEQLLQDVAHAPAVARLPVSAARIEAAFHGHPRFQLRRRLGEGGFGTVFEAEDRQRGGQVALKVLHRSDGQALYRFKQEFRALAGLRHPHLVSLYELFTGDDLWFFTMERVAGADFLQHAAAAPDAETRAEWLRRSLLQLAGALGVLHGAGLLHRDLKPANVLVTGEGRVVVLDFGLVTRSTDLMEGPSIDTAGTPAYMAPERWKDAPVTPAADWYAVGVMLFQALTGRLPPSAVPSTEGRRSLPEEAPPDLAALCLALLEPEPSARPTTDEVVRRLSAISHEPSVTSLSSSPVRPVTEPLTGREAELASLESAFEAVRRGTPVSVLVDGPSGIGKSTLVQHFLTRLRLREPEAVLLTGRCYMEESVPFKALDGIVDALSRYLRKLPDSRAEAMLPGDVLPLLCAFPVLRQVPALARAQRRVFDAADAVSLRWRAFAALRELLSRLSHQLPVVIWIDDLQWGDTDSARPLEELLRPPGAPPLLLIGTWRSEEGVSGPLPEALSAAGAGGAVEVRSLHVGALEAEEALRLAMAHGARADAAAEIAREAGGNPLFIAELAHHSRMGVGAPAEAPEQLTIGLRQMLGERVGRLPVPARTLLSIIAVAGQPLDRGVALEAAGLSEGEHPTVGLLSTEHLLRFTADGRLDTYHDQVRAVVLELLDAATRREHHRRLALILARTGAGPEGLATHFLGAGEHGEARRHLLAFERAAQLYRSALDLPAPDESPSRGELLERLGAALANAGHSAEAGVAFLEAASVSGRADLRLLAAAETLKSGLVDDGLGIARQALAELRIALPTSPARARLDFVAQRILLRLRGLGFHPREEARIPASELQAIDACWSIGLSLMGIDFLLGHSLIQRYIRRALSAGEPHRVARALAIEASFQILLGGEEPAAAELLAQAEALAERHGAPTLSGYVLGLRALVCTVKGRFAESLALSERAEALFVGAYTNTTRRLAEMHNHRQYCLFVLGHYRRLVQGYAERVDDYRRRGDRFAEITLGANFGWLGPLMADDPAAASALIDELMGRWSQRGFHLQHFNALLARTQIDLYAGRATAALERMDSLWPEVRRSGLLHIKSLRFRAMTLRCRATLVSIAERELLRRAPSEARQLLARVERDLARQAKLPAPLGRAMLKVLRASHRRLLGQPEQAIALLTAAEAEMEALGARGPQLAIRRRRGELLGGEEGSQLIAEADAFFQAEGVRVPARIITVGI